MAAKKRTKKSPPPLKKFNVEFWGRADVSGIITVDALDEQAVRAAAFAQYQDDGIYWRVMDTLESYPVRIHSVEPA